MLNSDQATGSYAGTEGSDSREVAGSDYAKLLLKAVSQAGEGFCICDTDGRIHLANEAFEAMLGLEAGRAQGMEFPLARAWESDARRLAQMREDVRNAKQWSGQWTLKRFDDRTIVLESTFSPVRDETGQVSHCVSVHHDMTRETELAEKLRRAQKMEAVGRLAGGVAHDFNNLLTAVMGNAQILRMHLEDQPVLAAKARQVLRASKRAAELTGKLMSFAQLGACQLTSVDLHDIVSDVAEAFLRDHGDRLEVSMELRAQPSVTMGDPTHLRKAILNLAINAREAMDNGGQLVFGTCNVQISLDSPRCRELDLIPGRYICVTVSDTGKGMDDATQAHLFEPFFTTKEETEGAGLGLAGVYGCMRSHNGAIRVDSAPGQGTTVELYLPIHHGGERSPNVMSQETTRMKAGTGVVMVVDDESSIREMICDALEPMGYEVHGFAGGSEAIEFFQENHHRVGLVILDLIMPRMDGRQTFQRLKEIDPEIHALISTGYGTSEMAKRVIADGVRDFLAKPYRLDELSEMVSKHIRRPD